ncbi:MAG: hypothetical protein V1809_00135 [Planctomycetota bacterium]
MSIYTRMVTDIHALLASLRPEIFCDPTVRKEVTLRVKSNGYLEAARVAKPMELSPFDIERIETASPFALEGLKHPIEKHILGYDAPQESLEQMYFWLLDRMQAVFPRVEKISDTFAASPGSGYHTDASSKAGSMQAGVMRMLREINQAFRTIEMSIQRLKSLKAEISTVLPETDGEKRVPGDLERRYDAERAYLKSQMDLSRLYVRWLKPFLTSARALESASSENPALVTGFGTALLELVLLGIGEYSPVDDVKKGILPKFFARMTEKPYHPIVVVEMRLRTLPERLGTRFVYRGRMELEFTSYALHDAEIETLKKELDKADFGEVFRAVEGASSEKIDRLQKEIDELLAESSLISKTEAEKEVNPFVALFSFLRRKALSVPGEIPLTPDTPYEQILRSQALIEARKQCIELYETFKVFLGMPLLNQ